MPKEVITTIPEVATETPVVEVAPVKVPTTPESQEVNKNSTEKSTPAVAPKTIDPYCAKYVSKYTKSEYKKEKAKPEEVKDDCKDKNKESRSLWIENEGVVSVKVIQMDCDALAEKHYKIFSDWEEQYDSYHARCL